MLIVRGNDVLVLDGAQRNEISELLLSVAKWGIYAMNYRDKDSEDNTRARRAFSQTMKYLSDALGNRLSRSARVDTLARQMKSSYAMLLSQVEVDTQDKYESELASKQLATLRAEAQEASQGEALWYDLIADWPQDLAVDLGTAWNLLPAADAYPSTQDKAMQGKMTKARVYDEQHMALFFRYCKTVLSAHVLVAHPDENWVWVDAPADIEEHDWVKACKQGRLSYPATASGWGPHITKGLNWMKHLEWWHYTAQDVLHVFADKSRYGSIEANASIPREDTRELSYALKYGAKLSGCHTPQAVRASMESGQLLGERVGVISSKRENTKTGLPADVASAQDIALSQTGTGTTRETVSQDDIAREVFTEIDRNVSRLARLIPGIVSRMGVHRFERTVDRILLKAQSGAVLISLDITGWSPQMFRRLEMGFGDILMSFFDIPDTMRISKFFSESTFVTNRSGFHSEWQTCEGSVQGFFVTIDSMLHGFIPQFAVAIGKDNGKLDKGTTIERVVLIDDIGIAADKKSRTDAEVVAQITDTYTRLGPQPDIIKTLYGRRRMSFLNRLFRVRKEYRAEILTACKIFAKADVERERKFVTLPEAVASVFGAYAGASDRGANPIMCYTMAAVDALRSVAMAAGRGFKVTTTDSLVTAWLPVGLYGWSFPTFGQWATRVATCTADAGLGAVSRIARTLIHSSPQLARSMCGILEAISTAELDMPGYVHFIDDPYNIALKGTTYGDVRSLLARAAGRATKDVELRALLQHSNSAQYEAAIKSLVQTSSMDAALMAAYAETLPHAIIRNLTARAESSEALLMYTSFAERRALGGSLRSYNRKVTSQIKKVAKYALLWPENVPVPTGVQIAHSLRARILAGIQAQTTNHTLPSVEDLLAHQGQVTSAPIVVHIPMVSKATMYNGIAGGAITRSHESKPLLILPSLENNTWDPLTAAYGKMLKVCAALNSAGGEAHHLASLWGRLWVGKSDIPFVVAPIDSSVKGARLSGRLIRRTYSVMALPNLVSSVHVDAHSLFAASASTNTTIDPMSIVYTLKAAAILDIALGAASGCSRGYGLKYIEHYISMPTRPTVEHIVYTGGAALRQPAAQILAESLPTIAASARTDIEGETGKLDLPIVAASAEVGLSAFDVLESLPYGTVSALIMRSAVTGAGSGLPEEVRSASIEAHSDTSIARKVDLVTQAARNAIPFSSVTEQKVLGQLLQACLRYADNNFVADEHVQKTCQILSTSQQPALAKMGVSDSTNAVASGNLGAMAGIYSTLMKGARTQADYWASWAEQYATRALGVEGDKKSEMSAMSAGMRAWILCKTEGRSWTDVWSLTLFAIATDLCASYRRSGLNAHMSEILDEVTIPSLRISAGVGEALDIDRVMRDYGTLLDSTIKDRLSRLSGIRKAVMALHKFFAADWVAPVAAAEIVKAQPICANASVYHEIEFPTEEEVSIRYQEDTKAQAPGEAEWSKFVDEMSLWGTQYGEDEYIDAEFVAWKASQINENTDTA